jgi:ABC-2 type transport system permease protein
MNKIFLVLKNEIITLISRPSFWLALLGLPLVGALIFVGVGAINKSASATQTVNQVLSGPQDTRPEGYVDLSGIISQIPESVPPNTFITFPDEVSGRQALAAGEISALYVVPADYIQAGKITCIRPDLNPLATGNAQSGLFTWMLQVNLAGGDSLFANLVSGPLKVDDNSLAAVSTPDENNPLAFWTPYIITLIFYMLIVGSATLLLSNISKEKENRVIEMLLTSVTSRQLLTGKILGLGIVEIGRAHV